MEGRVGEGRRYKTMIFHLSKHLNAAGPPMERLPNLQQHAFTIGPPLPIPKPKLLDVLAREKLFPFLIMCAGYGTSMLGTVQLHR
jgi:hypothetical protein